MTWLILGGISAVGAIFCAIALAIRRAARSAVTGTPTPKEAQIATETAQQVEFVRESEDTERKEVRDASSDSLLARLRNSVRRPK